MVIISYLKRHASNSHVYGFVFIILNIIYIAYFTLINQINVYTSLLFILYFNRGHITLVLFYINKLGYA